MKVAMLVGMLMFNVIARSYYENRWALDASTDAGLSDGGDVHACEDPPPPSWP
jgi:hypothetical protein